MPPPSGVKMSNDQITNEIFIAAISETLSVDDQIILVKRATRRMSGRAVLDFINSEPVKAWVSRNHMAINKSGRLPK